ncbi:hypothetical protein FQN54_003887 [Arachnomyces sp. PD_36]|nr:hypothetical protein FQN54_003887 [Arachnomyces sp. PD_36]
MLRSRRPRDPNEPRPQWHQRRNYPDHLGKSVVLEEYLEPGIDPEPTEQLAIQVYSTVSLDEDHTALRDYLLSTWSTEDPKPLFEIYSYCPSDAFDCIDHNRREIAYRKRQHVLLGTPSPAPLIPFHFHPWDEAPIGCCILLNSHSYRLGHTTEDNAYEAVGSGPDWLYFNRRFAHCFNTVAKDNQVSPSQPRRELYPEGFEMETMHVRNQDAIGYHLMQNIFNNCTGFGPGRRFIHYGLDVQEGEAPKPAQPSEERIREELNRQLTDPLVFEPDVRISHDDGSVTAVNAPENTEPDLRYLIYAPFLSHLDDGSASALLETTARLFTTVLLYLLPSAKTVHLEFHIPPSNAWSSILLTHRNALRRHNDGDTFPIGALHNISANNNDPTPQRVSPQRRSDRLATAKEMLKRPYRVFAVVLDRALFVSEPGVCFYMTDYDTSNAPHPVFVSYPETQVWRSAGIHEVARRLAMLAVEEEQNGVEETRNLLPPEE